VSHTVKVIALGCALLAVLLIAARLIDGGTQAHLVRACELFIVLWFLGAAINMWVGVVKAGYSVAEEAPVFLVVFGVPAVVALWIWWRLSRG
jgi:hypothetical protein